LSVQGIIVTIASEKNARKVCQNVQLHTYH